MLDDMHVWGGVAKEVGAVVMILWCMYTVHVCSARTIRCLSSATPPPPPPPPPPPIPKQTAVQINVQRHCNAAIVAVLVSKAQPSTQGGLCPHNATATIKVVFCLVHVHRTPLAHGCPINATKQFSHHLGGVEVCVTRGCATRRVDVVFSLCCMHSCTSFGSCAHAGACVYTDMG